MWHNVRNFFTGSLWRNEPAGWVGRWLYPSLRIMVVMVQELAEGQLTLRAMSLVYTTLLSIVPLLAVSFSVLKGFGVHNQIEPILLTYLEPLGTRGEEIALHILTFVDNIKVGVLGSVGLGLLLFTIISLTQKVESAFNYVWRVRRTRSLPRRFSDYLSIIMVGPFLAFTALGMTATMMNSSIVQTLVALPGIGMVVVLAGKAVPYLLIIAAFVFVYMFVPNTKVHFRSALVGALVSGVLWETSSMLFASFVAGANNYTAIYSGFAILIFFMIWLYLSWFILLFGAQISYFHQYPLQIRPERDVFRFSSRLKERAGLLLLYLIADAYYQGRPRWTEEALIRRLGLPGDAVVELLHQLLDHGLVIDTADDQPGYLPARDPQQISLAEVFEVLRSAEEAVHYVRDEDLDLPPVNAVMDRLQQARSGALENLSLRDVVYSNIKP